MFVTLFAALFSAAFLYYHETVPTEIDGVLLSAVIAVGGITILVLTAFFNIMVLSPLEKLEQKLVPNLMEIFRRNFLLQLERTLLFIFPVLSFFLAILILSPSVPHKVWFFLGWIILFGFAIDLFRLSWKRVVNFLNPFYLVKQLEKDAEAGIRNNNDEQLWAALDSIAEVSLRSIEKSRIALSTQALQTFPPIYQVFFESSKSIARINVDKKVEKETGLDEASFTVYFLLQRLELINDRALQFRLETAIRQLITALGKIIIYAAEFDLSMVAFPTHFLTKFGLKAQQHHFDEVAVLTTGTLSEIAKTILTEIDVTYAELQQPFRAILNGLDALAKGTFKKRKDTSVSILIEPFLQVKTLLQTERMANHPDTPLILQEINRILEEWEALDKLMRGIPPIPELGDDMPVPPLPPQ
jgi:hypothetical protein